MAYEAPKKKPGAQPKPKTSGRSSTIAGGLSNEIRIKQLQKCSKIFLSPIFKSKKNQTFLSTIRFNIMTLSKNIDFIALGGVNENNYKKLKLTKAVGFAGISWIKKNGLSKLRPFL